MDTSWRPLALSAVRFNPICAFECTDCPTIAQNRRIEPIPRNPTTIYGILPATRTMTRNRSDAFDEANAAMQKYVPGPVDLRDFPGAQIAVAQASMAEQGFDTALDRIELALGRLEQAVTTREAELAEFTALKARHRKLKDTVSSELRQLDLLLASLPAPDGADLGQEAELPDSETPDRGTPVSEERDGGGAL